MYGSHFTVAFKMYDLDGDDRISRNELLAVLHMMVGANISEEQVNTILHRGSYMVVSHR